MPKGRALYGVGEGGGGGWEKFVYIRLKPFVLYQSRCRGREGHRSIIGITRND